MRGDRHVAEVRVRWGDRATPSGHAYQGWLVEVDGHELADKILGDSLRIDFPVEDGESVARVTMTLAADVDVDLPEAVLEAMRDDRPVIEYPHPRGDR